MDWSDKRPLEQLSFAVDAPEPERESIAARVRELLAGVGVVVADDIDAIGCTGLVANGLTVPLAQYVRQNIGGSAHPIPCFVPPDRFCFVHDVIGGLQEGQAPQFVDKILDISRPLTTEESRRSSLIERARRQNDPNPQARAIKTIDILNGRQVAMPSEPAATFTPDAPRLIGQALCTEHIEAVWGCRFCLAAELVSGAFEPKLLIVPTFGDNITSTDDLEPIAPVDVPDRLKEYDRQGADFVGIYVQAARFERKLAKG